MYYDGRMFNKHRLAWLGMTLAHTSLAIAAGQEWHWNLVSGLFFVLAIASAIWAFLGDKRPNAKRVTQSWIDIEQRFKELQKRSNEMLKGAVWAVQVMTREGGIYWHISGSTQASREAIQQVCAIGGVKVKTQSLGRLGRVKNEADDIQRWLWFLVEIGIVRKANGSISAASSEYPGEPVDYIRVEDLTAASIAGCVECIKLESRQIYQ